MVKCAGYPFLVTRLERMKCFLGEQVDGLAVVGEAVTCWAEEKQVVRLVSVVRIDVGLPARCFRPR